MARSSLVSFEITILAHFRAKPEALPALSAALDALIAATRQEPGCIAYDLHVACDDPCHFVLVERWRDAAALEAHFAQPHTQAAMAQTPPWLAEGVTLSRWRPVAPSQITSTT
ncbi:MAG: antibiotic biosynthesis monooxygenase [Chloracidobacterium sp. CP2_5A]|nr:MAG: antibiotic biosynthesis monooxygenase [Chloracidobacterium sp. CP2_5A]